MTRELAVGKVKRAIKSGRLTRGPCERCGSTVNIHGHHDDYSKPLDVMWLCMKHHWQRHRELGWGIGGRPRSGKERVHIRVAPSLMQQVEQTAEADYRNIGRQIEILLKLGLGERLRQIEALARRTA